MTLVFSSAEKSAQQLSQRVDELEEDLLLALRRADEAEAQLAVLSGEAGAETMAVFEEHSQTLSTSAMTASPDYGITTNGHGHAHTNGHGSRVNQSTSLKELEALLNAGEVTPEAFRSSVQAVLLRAALRGDVDLGA